MEPQDPKDPKEHARAAGLPTSAQVRTSETHARGETQEVALDRPELTSDQERLVFQAAARRVAAAVRSVPGERLEEVLADIGAKPIWGVFVSLKRARQLRSCCGCLGESITLHAALDHAAFRAAKEDPRFPPISPTELEHLDMEVWLLWGLEAVTAQGEDRIRAVTIGKHGLQISRGTARGLLLPGVAVEHNWDAKTFLEQVGRKAGLAEDAWKQDDATLMTFEGYAIRGRLAEGLTGDAAEALRGGPTQADVARLADFCRQNLAALAFGATPSFYLADGFDGDVCGAAVTVEMPGSTEKVQCYRVSLRPDVALQSALFNLVKAAADALAARRIPAPIVNTAGLSLAVFWDAAVHGTLAEPGWEGVDPAARAVMLTDRSRWSLAYDPDCSLEELVSETAEKARFPDPSRAQVYSLAVASTSARFSLAHVPEVAVRPPAVAGRFYPGTAEEINRALERMLPREPKPEPWAAAMVPHAGWIYSGRLAAEVFSRVAIPERVIVICPAHREHTWAVAPHQTWSLPGGHVESDPELAQELARAVTGLKLDASAHATEHAIEVQLPILARLAPQARVVGIAMHGGDLAGLERFADEMAGVIGKLPQRPLLVISTDMSHHVPESEARRLDRLALAAIEALDPARLYETVVEHGISMCGMRPAVVVMETLRRLGSLSQCERVGYTTSAEASGETRQVVGYAGMLFK